MIFDLIGKKFKIPQKIEILAQKRVQARDAKNWSTADKIRDQLLELGWVVEDTDNGYNLKPVLKK